MYYAMIVLLMGAFPIAAIAFEYGRVGVTAGLAALTVKWFLFWAVGARLLIAGIRQVADPAFTAQTIFSIEDKAAFAVVRELGYWNLIIGALAMATLWRPAWMVPLAIAGCAYFGLAGILHLFEAERTARENAAMISDLWVAVVLAAGLFSMANRAG
jgi:hypothetical protein